MARFSFEELESFLATANAGSFTVAATHLGKDPSAISRGVSQLEKRLGVRLLTRTTRTVSLTEAGTSFARRARAAMDELEVASREVTSFGAEPQGLLRVTAGVSYGREVITPLVPAFLKKFPRVTLELEFVDRHVDLIAEGFDLAVRAGSVKDSSLTVRRVDTFTSIIVATEEYLARYPAITSPADLSSHCCLGFTKHYTWPQWTFEREGEQASVTPKGPLTSNSMEPLIMAAKNGEGVCLAADYLVVRDLMSGTLKRVLPEWQYIAPAGVFMVTPPGGMIPGKTRAFVEEIIQALKMRPRPAKGSADITTHMTNRDRRI